ncbi:MAG TPA: glycosyltransferase [Candidatus Eremiobacteraceae bacterium]|nr:glycosyltransferase [Candidatus Eremiobacteraceae bacterium]
MPSLGLAMIVKNGAETLQQCLRSIAGVTNQIVIADTGSSDGTPQLARELGADVFDFSWQDDFAQARNAAIHALATDWVLIMDDDEELDPRARERIPALLNRAEANHAEANHSGVNHAGVNHAGVNNAGVGGYLAILRNHIPVRFGSGGHAASIQSDDGTIARAKGGRAYADFAICRLFRRHPQIYYVGRVHEHVEPRIHALNLELAAGDFVIHHFGHLCSAAELRAKNEFYRKLGRLKVQDVPNDPEAWVELGLQEYEQFKNYSAGIECFEKALALNPSYSSVPLLSLANLYIEIQADARALELLSGRVMSGRAAGAKEQICGDACYNLGRLKEARSAYLRALHILPEDSRIVSKLGLTEVRMGLKKNGLARLIRALNAAPVLEMHDRLIKAYLFMNLMPQAAEAAERLAVEYPNPVIILRAASIRSQMKQWKAAEDLVARGLQIFPQSQELLQAKAELEEQNWRSQNSDCVTAARGLARPAGHGQAQNSAYCTTGLSEETSLARP